jgi:hypothetical protein
MKKFFKYFLYLILGLGLLLAILLFIGYLNDFPINGITRSAKSNIEKINLGQNTTVNDAIIHMAGAEGEVVWEKQENDYFVSIIHGKSANIIKFTYNPSTYTMFLTGFKGADGNKCEKRGQVGKCIIKYISKHSE